MFKKLSGRHAVIGLMLIACVVLVIGIVTSHIAQAGKQDLIDDYTSLIEQQTNANSELEDVINSGDISDYASDVARDQLGFGESDEKVYVDITGK